MLHTVDVQIGTAAAYTALQMADAILRPGRYHGQAGQPHVRMVRVSRFIARREVYWSIDLNWDVVEIECSELGVEKSGDVAEAFVKISPSSKLEHFYLLC